MKNVLLATSMLFTATAVSAADLIYFGSAEYSVETEVFETTAGVSATVWGPLAIAPVATFSGTSDDFGFTEVELNGIYTVSQNVNAYVSVSADEDLNYTDTTIGVSFQF